VKAIDPHYGHWRGTLEVAAKLSKKISKVAEVQLSYHSSSIILSRTAIEIYTNEAWFTIASAVSQKAMFDRYVNLHVVDRLNELADLISVKKDAAYLSAIEDIELSNGIRNYCIHYTGPILKMNLISKLGRRLPSSSMVEFDPNDPQMLFINPAISKFCLDAARNVIMLFEQNRIFKTSLSAMYIKFCRELKT
jgi:hypothetical protein